MFAHLSIMEEYKYYLPVRTYMDSVLDILEIGKEVISAEKNGLELTKNSLNHSFVHAVEILHKTRGHIVLTGMGKPGHIAKKISATLASTGSQSFFLHPAEASHGDLGMLSTEDTILALSFSGNTSELFPLLEYAKRFGINVVGITAGIDSVLAKTADILIVMPKLDEATPSNLAPTTSSTAMLAIGDAIAVCLLKLKKFQKDDFKKLHPGGALGKQLLKVSDLMHKTIPSVNENDLMHDVIIKITAMSFGCVCVLNSIGEISGIITDGDLRRHMLDDILKKTAKDVMSRSPKMIDIDMFAVEATKFMNDNKITSLFVKCCDNNVPVGILHIHDCLRAGLC